MSGHLYFAPLGRPPRTNLAVGPESRGTGFRLSPLVLRRGKNPGGQFGLEISGHSKYSRGQLPSSDPLLMPPLLISVAKIKPTTGEGAEGRAVRQPPSPRCSSAPAPSAPPPQCASTADPMRRGPTAGHPSAPDARRALRPQDVLCQRRANSARRAHQPSAPVDMAAVCSVPCLHVSALGKQGHDRGVRKPLRQVRSAQGACATRALRPSAHCAGPLASHASALGPAAQCARACGPASAVRQGLRPFWPSAPAWSGRPPPWSV